MTISNSSSSSSFYEESASDDDNDVNDDVNDDAASDKQRFCKISGGFGSNIPDSVRCKAWCSALGIIDHQQQSLEDLPKEESSGISTELMKIIKGATNRYA